MKKIVLLFILLAFLSSCSLTKKIDKDPKSKIPPTIASIIQINNTSDFIDANTQKILGNYSNAQTIFEKCIDNDPENDAAWYELSVIYANNLDLPHAVEAAENAYKLDNENLYYILNLALLYNKNYDTDKCIEMYEKLIELQPENIETQLNYTNVLLTTQDYDKTLSQLNKMEAIIGPEPDIYLKKVKIYESQKKWEKAYAELEKLSSYYPANTQYLSILAELYLKNGKEKDAMNCYKRIEAINPNDPYIHFTLFEYYKKSGDEEKAHSELVKGFSSPKLDVDTKVSVLFANYTSDQIFVEKNTKAFELLRTLAETHPTNGLAQTLIADYYYHDDKIGMARKHYYDALHDVQNPALFINLIQIEVQLDHIDSVFTLSSQAIDLFPLTPEFYFFKGIALSDTKNYTDALATLNDGVNLVVNNDFLKSSFYTYIGDCYYSSNQLENAYSAYDKAILFNTENYYVLNNYSYYLSTSNTNLDKAEIMGKKIADAQPENSHYLDTYGWALFKNNKYKDALHYIETALKYATPSDKAVVMEHLGDVKWKLNDFDGAVEAWQASFDLDPTNSSELLKKKIQNQAYYEE